MSKFQDLENTFEVTKDHNGNQAKIMSKRFTFKPPAFTGSNGNSNSNSKPLTIAKKPSVTAAQEAEDLWLDDIDEDMLVQASQMVEAASATASKVQQPERMEIDAETLNKFITEENKTDVWGSDFTSQRQKFPQQTQTVFQSSVRSNYSIQAFMKVFFTKAIMSLMVYWT